MEAWVTIIQSLGFPIACVVACGVFIYYIIKRDKDEAKAREDKLIEANIKSSEALDKVADTIVASDVVNKELSETNKLLVDKIEGNLVDISNNVEKVLDKLNSKN